MNRVRFTKNQLRALAQFEVKANRMFDEDMANNPYLYLESDRSRFVRAYIVAQLQILIDDGFVYEI